jgi:endonuclease/exonuclease/phosphatase (EEP) superfamily protein YafD
LNNEYKVYAIEFIHRLKKSSKLRSTQTQTILTSIDNSPYPVIILGDFNDTPQSYTYQKLQEGRKDAFIERGTGWGATYLKPLPFLRIDYILHDDELTCTSYQSSSSIKSDHSLVEASFNISK